jgi:hypothetical protein
MSRVPKHIASELITFVKRLEIKANFWDERSTSAFEFSRQMSSRKLKKIHPSFDFVFENHNNENPPLIKAEFVDGSKWEIDSSNMKAVEIRAMFYGKASDAEESSGNDDKK